MQRGRRNRNGGRALQIALAVIIAFSPAEVHAQGGEGFYEASTQQLVGTPGTIIRKQRIRGAPLGAAAYRVLYRSVGLAGEPIAVSGTVVVPAGAADAGSPRIIAWAHPTTGIVPRCAPSLAFFKFQQIQGLRNMVARGYVVAATDYPGLGTPGPHPYLVGDSEGRAVLDSGAARNLVGNSDGKAARFAAWGHSQGGQAVLFAALRAKTYAPELDLAGVAAAAPATDLGTLMRDDFATPGGKNLLAMTLWSWSRVFGAPLDGIVDPAALPVIDRLAQVCLESPIDMRPRRLVGEQLQRRFLTVDNLTEREPWRGLLASNTISALPPEIPVFLAQGASDDTVIPAVTRSCMQRLCAAGSGVRMVTLEGVGHGVIATRSALTAIGWIADRFDGKAAPSDCGR